MPSLQIDSWELAREKETTGLVTSKDLFSIWCIFCGANAILEANDDTEDQFEPPA